MDFVCARRFPVVFFGDTFPLQWVFVGFISLQAAYFLVYYAAEKSRMERHGMVYYLLTFLSILLETGKNVFSNNFSKNVLKNDTDIYKFNTFLYIGSLAVLLCTGNYALSWYTAGMAFLFAAVTALSQYFLLKALARTRRRFRQNGSYSRCCRCCSPGGSGSCRRCTRPPRTVRN